MNYGALEHTRRPWDPLGAKERERRKEKIRNKEAAGRERRCDQRRNVRKGNRSKRSPMSRREAQIYISVAN